MKSLLNTQQDTFKITLKLGSIAFLLLSSQSYGESEIYGSISYDYENSATKHQSQPTPNINYQHQELPSSHSSKSLSKSNIDNNDTYIGIKGEKDIGNGNAIIYQLEIGNDR